MDAVVAGFGATSPTPLARSADADASPAVARVAESAGTVTVVRGKGSRETLREGDFLYQGDAVETTGDGAVKLLFTDGTQFALADNAVFVIDRYEYDFATQEGLAAFSILKGMFLFAAGEIAAQDPHDMTISTPVATIALRDGEPSRFVGDVSPAGEVSRFTLLAGDVILFTKAGAITLDLVNETAVLQNSSVIPTSPILLERDEITRLYGPIGKIAGDFFGAPDEEKNLAEIAELLAEIAPAAGPEEEGATDEAAPVLDSPFRLDSTPFRDDGSAVPGAVLKALRKTTIHQRFRNRNRSKCRRPSLAARGATSSSARMEAIPFWVDKETTTFRAVTAMISFLSMERVTVSTRCSAATEMIRFPAVTVTMSWASLGFQMETQWKRSMAATVSISFRGAAEATHSTSAAPC